MGNEWVKSSFLGIMQGLTEFLPVSSSGHLAVFNFFLTGGKPITMLEEIILHAGTMIAILLFFFRDIIEDVRKDFKNLFINVFLATISTVPVALSLRNFSENSLSNLNLISLFFLVTALFLFLPSFKKGNGELSWKEAIAVGLAQGIGVLPGISRSGITIATGIILGVKPEKSFRFSFYISIPAVWGAVFLECLHSPLSDFRISMLSGFFFSLIAGTLALFLLKDLAIKGKMWYFSLYLFALSMWVWLS